MDSSKKWPILADDLDYLDENLRTKRKVHSERAGTLKRNYVNTQRVSIVLGVVLIGLGAAGPALSGMPEGDPAIAQMWLAIIGAVISFLIGFFVLIEQELDLQREWLDKRRASEAMKHERFYFLGRVEDYHKVQNPQTLLDRRLREIEDELALGDMSGDGSSQ